MSHALQAMSDALQGMTHALQGMTHTDNYDTQKKVICKKQITCPKLLMCNTRFVFLELQYFSRTQT